MTAEINNGKVSGLNLYLDWLAEKGKVKASAISPLKNAVKAMFATVDKDDWLNTEVDKVDLNDYMQRFKNLSAGTYTAGSYTVYQSRINRAINWYKNFLANPGWAPTMRHQESSNADTRKTSVKKAKLSQKSYGGIEEGEVINDGSMVAHMDGMQNALSTGLQQNDTANLLSYPFPLSDGSVATLNLPRRITTMDAKRLGAFISTLVMDGQDDENK